MIVVALLFVVPFDYRNALAVSIAGMVICLSFVVITGFVGQVSLVQVALAGVAGFTVSHLTTRPASDSRPRCDLRRRHAATALGFARGRLRAARARREPRGRDARRGRRDRAVRVREQHVGRGRLGVRRSRSRRSSGSTSAPSAGLGAISGGLPSPALGCLLLAIAVAASCSSPACAGADWAVRMLAVRSNERAAAASGISVRTTKFAAYAISSCIAGVGGVLYAYALGSVNVDRFGILIALQFVAFSYVGGITMVSGAVLAGLMTAEGVIPHFLDAQLGFSATWTLLAAGVLLILCLLLFPDGIAGSWRRRRLRRVRLSVSGIRPERQDDHGDTQSGRRHTLGATVLAWGLLLWVVASVALAITEDEILLPSVVLIGSFLVPVATIFWFLDHRGTTPSSSEQRLLHGVLRRRACWG